MTLRNGYLKVVLVDTPGLDAEDNTDAQTMAQVRQLENVLCILIVIKRNETIGAQMQEVIRGYEKTAK